MLSRVHGGNIWPYLKSSKNKIIDFSANINPLGLPSRVKEIIIRNINHLIHYPEPKSKDLRSALGSFHNIKSHNILIGNGSIELIHLIPRALKIKSALIIIPAFSEYEFAMESNNGKTIFLRTSEQDNFKIHIQQIKKIIPKVELVFLCNPNNPTGSILHPPEVLALLELCKKYNTLMLIDEVFIDFAQNSDELTLLPKTIKFRHLLVLRSLTKFFGIAGLRLGYLIASRQLISKISQFQYPWNVNSLAQIVGREIIKDRDFIKKSKEFICKEREYLLENLTRLNGLRVYPPSSNFIFCKLQNNKIKNSQELNEKLIQRNIIIRTANNFRGLHNRFFRVAIRKRKENMKLISNLKAILG